ncbi:hypothetical protein AM493_18820 [Flavobacterium akiainvivens]|uniref:Calx-beta domain-containing protein n=1 Tax=Flavobacterium akiainvivens TaxID=1202724 RepID=A0A0M9VJV9_9FLAO|nr:DUF4843 domain-containing protein [Flavobacterium akiainvivens]KOS07882.1 hypothetical protein AM493_18820 [Flavobacterium akiainvivens]SFQ28069.1 protein of unknown function [Flavobacterium akiainvivens]
MKNIFKSVALVLFSALVLTGCEEDKVVFDNRGGQTMLAFDVATQNIGVGPAEGENVGYVVVNSTTVSDQPRTFTVQVDESSTAIAGVEYTIDQSTYVIPAGEYNAQIKITGNFDELAEGENKTIVLNIVTDGSFTVDRDETIVTIYRSCPVPSTFGVGNYLLEQVTEAGADGPVLEDGAVRAVTVDPANPNVRIFTTYNFPNFCSTTRNNFAFELKCGLVVSGTNSGNCVCTQGSPYTFGPATTSEAYDTEDDTVLYLAFTNDVTGNCGPSNQVVYKLTKQ